MTPVVALASTVIWHQPCPRVTQGKFALSFILGNHIKRKQRKDKEDGDKEKDSEEDATTAPEDNAPEDSAEA